MQDNQYARHVFAFNGDADGLCALQQLRLAERVHGTLVTGVKRDIRLLERIDARGRPRHRARRIARPEPRRVRAIAA